MASMDVYARLSMDEKQFNKDLDLLYAQYKARQISSEIFIERVKIADHELHWKFQQIYNDCRHSDQFETFSRYIYLFYPDWIGTWD